MLSSTRALMTLTAAFAAALGVTASFLPQEILAHGGAAPEWFPVVVVQIAGALYLGVAILNWMARGALIGGIYGRPIALANFMHFAVAAIVLIKAVAAGQSGAWLLTGTAAYAGLAVWWGLVLFTSPSPSASRASST
jgi:hypothetical protein